MRFPRPLLVAILALAPLAGCKSCQQPSGQAAPDAAPSVGGLTAEQAQKPLAKFGDHVITLGDFAKAIAEMPEYERLRYQSLDRRKELLRSMIDVQLLADEAQRQGLDKDPIVQEETRQILVAWMRGKLLSEVPQASAITEGEVKAYYDAHRDLFREPERRRVAQIVTRDEAVAKKAADEAKSAGAVGWGALVKKYSDDKPAASEAPEMYGDLGYVAAPSDAHAPVSPRLVPEVRAAVFGLKEVGAIADPVKDAAGVWHVVRLLAKQEARDQSLQDVDRTIRVRIVQEKRADREKQLVDETRKSLKVEVDEAALSAIALTLAAGPGVSSVPSASSSAAPSSSASASASASTKR
jgi:parvulin-like peptidyl-prolyl isomerase